MQLYNKCIYNESDMDELYQATFVNDMYDYLYTTNNTKRVEDTNLTEKDIYRLIITCI